MNQKTRQLGQLAKIARVKADTELRKYASYRSQAEAMRGQVELVRAELSEALAAPTSEALETWSMATALVGYRTGQVHRAETMLTSMQPALEAARSAAVKAYGRAEAMTQLQRMTLARERLDRQRRSE